MFRQGAAEYNRFAPCLFDKKKYNSRNRTQNTNRKVA